MRFFLGLLCVVIFSFASDLKIATYNVENLFDGYNNGNEYRDFRIGKSDWSLYKSQQKLKRIRDIIVKIDADILALQEIENEQILKELIKDTKYKYYIFRSTKNAPVGLGVISKIKPVASEYFNVKNVKTRDILKVEYKLGLHSFYLFINHFPAFKKNKISSQYKALNVLKSAIKDEKNVILLGDFNTPFGKKSILNSIIKQMGYKDLWIELDYKQRYSFAAYGKKGAIDHVLLSSSFFKNFEIFYSCNSFKVFKDRSMVDEKGYVKKDGKRNYYSDHLPLVFEISTNKDKKCNFWDKL